MHRLWFWSSGYHKLPEIDWKTFLPLSISWNTLENQYEFLKHLVKFSRETVHVAPEIPFWETSKCEFVSLPAMGIFPQCAQCSRVLLGTGSEDTTNVTAYGPCTLAILKVCRDVPVSLLDHPFTLSLVELCL